MGTYNSYTKEQAEFLQDNAFGLSRKELTDKFNAKFNTCKTRLTITTWCNRRNLVSGFDGRVNNMKDSSWQKGLSKEEYKSHFSESSFAKSLSGISNRRKHKIGDEIVRDGQPYIIISVEKAIDIDKRIVSKRRYVYEKVFGVIPKGHRIINLDGNAFNCEPDNLYCIPVKFIPILNKNKWLTHSREHTLTAIKWCELFYARNKGR